MDNAPPAIDRLIFIYNADGGIMQGLIDTVHKAVSPSTYSCSLCAITYGALRMQPRWRAWLKAQPFATLFEHKDDTRHRDVALPAVLVECGGATRTLIDAPTLDDIASVDALIAAIEARLS